MVDGVRHGNQSDCAAARPLRAGAHAAGLMLGMLSGLDRKNCWTIAKHRGQVKPDGLQHLLSRAKWDADEVRDDLHGYVIDAFGDRKHQRTLATAHAYVACT